MKMVVVKSPKLLAGLLRIIFRIRKEPADSERY
ncbi:MAG: stage V sporulation protein SpoVM [Huintestinicola sp.]